MKNIFIGLLLSLCLHASATLNEFIPCKKSAVSVLKLCLKNNNNYQNDICWEKSKKSYDACSNNVIKLHEPINIGNFTEEALKELDRKPSFAAHTFVSSSNGHNKKRTKQKAMKKAEARAKLECKEHSSNYYRIKPARCSINKGKQHEIWNCMTIVSCFKD